MRYYEMTKRTLAARKELKAIMAANGVPEEIRPLLQTALESIDEAETIVHGKRQEAIAAKQQPKSTSHAVSIEPDEAAAIKQIASTLDEVSPGIGETIERGLTSHLVVVKEVTAQAEAYEAETGKPFIVFADGDAAPAAASA